MSAEWDDLARLAEAATPGPWQAVTTGRAGGDHWYVTDAREAIAHISAQDGINEDQRQPDAEFIAAANPATILRLITENRALSERLALAYRAEVLAHDERDALAAKVAAVEALIPEMEADIPYDSGNATSQHIATLLRAALDGAQ